MSSQAQNDTPLVHGPAANVLATANEARQEQTEQGPSTGTVADFKSNDGARVHMTGHDGTTLCIRLMPLPLWLHAFPAWGDACSFVCRSGQGLRKGVQRQDIRQGARGEPSSLPRSCSVCCASM